MSNGALDVGILFNSYLGPVHTTPEKFENVALFLRLALPSNLIRHENGENVL